jgi:hypothetical protein
MFQLFFNLYLPTHFLHITRAKGGKQTAKHGGGAEEPGKLSRGCILK